MKRALFCLSCALWPLVASSHHAGALFDTSRQLTLTGTVREFQWTNPHSFIQLLVDNGSGTDEWSVEMGPPGALYRQGWRPSTLKAGEKVTVVINPTKDGTKGGNFLSGTGSDGKPLGKPGAY